MTHEEYVGVGEAARRCGVSSDSIRRRLRAGRLPGARRAGASIANPWLIPLSALQEAGFDPDSGVEPPPRPSATGDECPAALARALERIDGLTALVDDLRATLAHERALAGEQRVWLDRLLAPRTESAGSGD